MRPARLGHLQPPLPATTASRPGKHVPGSTAACRVTSPLLPLRGATDLSILVAWAGLETCSD